MCSSDLGSSGWSPPAPTGPAAASFPTRRLNAVPGPYDLTPAQVAALVPDDPPFRARQIWDGLYRRTLTVSEMTDLPLPLRQRLAGEP